MFDNKVAAHFIERIEKLTPQSTPQWGKMNATQMLAHCNVTYEMTYENIHPKPGAIVRFILKLLVKPNVVGPNPYKKNNSTAPQFIITDNRDFETEKNRLLHYIKHTQALGAEHFENRDSHSFGKLTSDQWNTMFAKHLTHHLTQFDI